MEKLEDVNQLVKKKEEKTKELYELIKRLEEAEEQLERPRAKANAGSPASSPPEDLQKLREDLNNHKDWLEESHDDNMDLQNANEALKGQVKELERRKEELGKQHKENQNEIKKLQTENDALKLHLKLVIDSLKNPIPEVEVRSRDKDGSIFDESDNAETSDDEGDYDSDSTAYGEDELQEEMRSYLQDMGNLRKLIGGDLSRFKDGETVRMPLGTTENV